jgi:hypothetical protein
MTAIDELYATLDRRAMPSQVARIIRDSGMAAMWPFPVRRRLDTVADAHGYFYFSSMSDDFERAADCTEQLARAARVFGVSTDGIDPADAGQVRDFITLLGRGAGGWEPGFDWKRDRLNKDDRRGNGRQLAGIDPELVAKRQYNRHVRVLRHLHEKAERMRAAQHRRELLVMGRSGFIADITPERFAADPVAACYIAYYTARKNERRQFSLAGRGNPVDHLAQGLLDMALASDRTDFEMLSWVFPRPAVLARLDPAALGRLLGAWHAVMALTADQLRDAWPGDERVDRLTMIVRRGMDSSTWNTLAQAYNAARAAWLGCLAASGALGLLEPACPGKVMRLMAADLAYWHRAEGSNVDSNTLVWARLPLPWQVLREPGLSCTAGDVRTACAEAGLDPEAAGWLAPRPDGQVATFRPTPDLVHGIEVADPTWRSAARRSGRATASCWLTCRVAWLPAPGRCATR